ncbi:VOC family protein [Jiulongibacter sediminis]|jgi:glyoxylase I family protein|uniref:SMU1112c/YaeR family gloxylase I-like metalloprotein n=1 Tax=Jiulongibacter sediminis TaxID=1605367 RepID=UPI0026ED2C65|nr:VOC family protein [Jiulongibacter sediminis]
MLKLKRVHHIAIICSDYQKSKAFYSQILGFEVLKETFRETRQSYKLDLTLNGEYVIELFSFPDPPSRVSRPEATGLRHLAFEVENVEVERQKLIDVGITAEPIRIDEITGKKFTFFADPDGLPLELYEG